MQRKENNGNVYQFPISREMRKCEDEKVYPSSTLRSALIRDAYTCVSAAVGCEPRDDVLQDAAKQICKRLSILKDPKPPAWPDDKEFNEWVNILLSAVYS